MTRGAVLLHCVSCLVGVSKGNTQTTSRERQVIAAHSRLARRAVEIGVFEGVTTAVIAASMAADGIVFGVDPFPRGRLGISYGKLITRKTLRRNKVEHKVQLVEMLSFDAAEVLTGPFEFVFVDGDHSYEGITRDWADWSGKVSVGGRIALHDTQGWSGAPEVSKFGSARFFQDQIIADSRFNLIESVDSMNVLLRVA